MSFSQPFRYLFYNKLIQAPKVVCMVSFFCFWLIINCFCSCADTGYAYPHTWFSNNKAWFCFLCWLVNSFGMYLVIWARTNLIYIFFLWEQLFMCLNVWLSPRILNFDQVVEHGLGHLPFTEKQVITPTGKLMLIGNTVSLSFWCLFYNISFLYFVQGLCILVWIFVRGYAVYLSLGGTNPFLLRLLVFLWRHDYSTAILSLAFFYKWTNSLWDAFLVYKTNNYYIYLRGSN